VVLLPDLRISATEELGQQDLFFTYPIHLTGLSRIGERPASRRASRRQPASAGGEQQRRQAASVSRLLELWERPFNPKSAARKAFQKP
jgi:hypothetical protein